MEKKSILLQSVGVLISIMICTSCNIHDDLAECPSGQQFRFIYDKTISGGNAFGAQVGYVSLYVFDQNGDYITTLEDYGSALDENAYRMQTNLSSGTYNLITWCRQTPEETAFEVNDFTSFYDMEKTLITDNGISDANLPASWNANTEEIEILNDGGEYTVSLTRNTNNVRVVLQQINGSSVDPADFDFTILGKSKVISGSDNLPYGDVNYKPYTTGQSTVGGDEDGSNRITVAYAEFSTSRLMVGSNARLQIDNQTTDKTVLDIPLIDYLVMRSEAYMNWSDQEYLDREMNYTLILFLDANNQWVTSTIIVNGWTVRINNI